MEDRAGPLGLLAAVLAGSLAILVSMAPLGVPPNAPIGPNFLLIVIGFWSLRRPSALPAAVVFVLGLTHDLLRDGPIGAELLALLIVAEGLRSFANRAARSDPIAESLRFAAAATAYEAIVWLLLAAAYAPTPALTILIQRWAATIIFFPLAAMALQRVFGVRSRPERFRHLRR